jgi:aarF domain-containing kinase
MSIIVDLFSAQIFAYGDIHCDPHPANIIVRRQPSGKPQVVLIDHGLYVRTTPEFRRQYARLWRALLTLNDTEIRAVTQHWGIRAPELFASATMNRPYGGGDGRAGFDGAFDEHPTKTPEERQFEMQQRMRDGIRDIFADEQRLPRELLFIGRNLRIVQGLNQRFGSPVNRIRSMGEWASRSLVAADARAPHDASWRAAASRVYDHAVFSLVLALSDLAYWAVAAGAWLGVVTGGAAKGGLDEIMDRRMKSMAKDMGVELQEDVSMFSG